MPVSIHLPGELLKKVDARARRLGMTRSGYIAQTLERDVGDEQGWTPGFFDELRHADPELEPAVDELVRGLRRKSRKGPPAL
jgi:predicted transcriptional regulator